MSLYWASDFSYNYFKKILQATKSKFELCRFREAPQTIERLKTETVGARPRLFLRHDVDVSLKRATTMASIEKDLGIRATYMVMTDSLLYSLEDPSSRDKLKEIQSMDHEIGLHIETNKHESEKERVTEINSACERLKNIIGNRVSSFAYHAPGDAAQDKQLYTEPLKMPDGYGGYRVNAYARELTGYQDDSRKTPLKDYLADSHGRWREAPLETLKNYDRKLLQLLIHPIWWGHEHMQAKERLKTFVLEETGAVKLRDKIIETVSVEFDLC